MACYNCSNIKIYKHKKKKNEEAKSQTQKLKKG